MKDKSKVKRCVNLDWLEVYCLESRNRFPCNADYFRANGWYVREREYGTRVWREMFVLEDDEGEPYIEIRRNPCSGEADINGLVPESCHIRFNNRACYYTDAIERLRQFMLTNDYIFKKIFRIDICYDFRVFDSGDLPANFARRYIELKYRKVNQAKVRVIGDDHWTDFEWESLSWGSRHSMISTKMYNKTKELSSASNDKPYIRQLWFESGLVADPVGLIYLDEGGIKKKAEIWRIEFSLKSGVDGLIQIERVDQRKKPKEWIPHTLDLYDAPDKLWKRFQELAFHYFQFRHYEEGKRKDLCKPKELFNFTLGSSFLQVSKLPKKSKPEQLDLRLEKLLRKYREVHLDVKIREACDILIKQVKRTEIRRLVTSNSYEEVTALQIAIARKMEGDPKDAALLIAEIRRLLAKSMIF